MIQDGVWDHFKVKVENINQIAEWALVKHQQKISEKYNSIENTIKILNSLIQDFGKKADHFEINLKGKTRIEDLQFQKCYYEKRTKECVKLSQKLKGDLDIKKSEIRILEEEAQKLKKRLIIEKTSNIKYIMKIEEIEKKQKTSKEKENIQIQKQQRKSKKNYERSLLIIKQTPYPLQHIYDEKQFVQKALFDRINAAMRLRSVINESYALLKNKLINQEKKSNKSGLAGSLYFRLQSKAEKLSSVSDSKLLIYDVLRQKYSRMKKEEKKVQENFYVELQEFLLFNPLQILGIIELKGGLNFLNSRKSSSDQYIQIAK